MLAAATGGGIVGGIPGARKAKFGAHVLITTIMLNFVVLAVLNFFLAARLKVPGSLHTKEIATGAIPRLETLYSGFHGSAAIYVLVLALFWAVAVWWFLFKTRRGFELRATGLQPLAAEYGGVNVGKIWVIAMSRSGAIAGLGGLNYVLGYKHYYEEGFAGGACLFGIAVALLWRAPPLGVVVAPPPFPPILPGRVA